MQADIYLIAAPDASAATVAGALAAAARDVPIAALLLPRGGMGESAYRDFVGALTPVAQARDVAVLIEGNPALVRALGVDGLHVTGGIGAVRDAIATLKPDFVVGAGDIGSRDDAMSVGEAGVDYVLFGPISGPISAPERELARWWAETMTISGVLSDPEARLDAFDAAGCEFIGLSTAVLEPAP